MYQEEIDRQTIAISLTASKLTGQTLAKALQQTMQQIEQIQRNTKTPHGRQSVKKLMNHGVNTSGIPLDGNTLLFDRFARKKNVDYAFYKTGHKKYLLFFKAGQADAITQCFAEYTKRVMNKNRKPSMQRQMRKADEITRNRPHECEPSPRVADLKREAKGDDR